ncbi:MAG: sigma-54-dependent Fis family transcriptional regulator [Alteromonadaceae bacterium]|nr:sigma-54-dependent Fis family transcriptional regulator [Alteromonadaceae bacterium]
MSQILVIDDRSDIRLTLNMLLKDNNYDVVEADSPQIAQLMIKKNDISLILLDMNYTLDTTSGEEGLSFLSWLKASEINIPTIAMTAWSNVDLAVKAMQLGANDFIEKPWKNKRLLQIIQQQIAYQDLQTQNTKLKQQLAETVDQAYVWRSASMLQLMQQIKTVANTDAGILLTGENGTGKSDLARHIHKNSPRKNASFVSVNMGAISESLFESEMFGHKKGAFTDAKSNRIGRFELAEQGSLFLDEIANIPLAQQSKLLRVLESGEYEVLGSSQTLRTNIRIISATNGNIANLIKKEVFREDLYYRLNTIEFRLPSLKERGEDIIPLAEFFIKKFGDKYNRPDCTLEASAKTALSDYHWPGNIRELSHLIERAVLLCQNDNIKVDDLHLTNSTSTTNTELPLITLEEAEIKLIKLALKKTDNNVPQAATLLGLTKSSMYRRLEKYEILQS